MDLKKLNRVNSDLINIALKVENYYFRNPNQQTKAEVFTEIENLRRYIESSDVEPLDGLITNSLNRQEKIEKIKALRTEYLAKKGQMSSQYSTLTNVENNLRLLKKIN